MYGQRMVVPKALQAETLSKLHKGHQGKVRRCLRAKMSVWWPAKSSRRYLQFKRRRELFLEISRSLEAEVNYDSECHQYFEKGHKYLFQYTTSSPYFPSSNGRAVQRVKNPLKNSNDPFLALLSYRATPLPWSPAKLLMGRKICSTLSMATPSLEPQ